MSRLERLGAAGRALAVGVLASLLVGAVVTDGRTRALALALVATWLLLGLLAVSVGRARETGRLPQHLVFATVFVAGSAGGALVREATAGVLPAPAPAGIGICVWIGAAWGGAGVAYRGPLDRVFDRVGPDG
jgi:hypothetical protein